MWKIRKIVDKSQYILYNYLWVGNKIKYLISLNALIWKGRIFVVIKRMKRFLHLLQNEGNEVDYSDLGDTLKDAVSDDVSVYLVDKNGRLLAYALEEGFESTEFDEKWLAKEMIPDELNTSFLKVGAVSELTGPNKENILVAPIVGAGRRVGSILFVGYDVKFDKDDIIIAEFAATAIGMIIANIIDVMQEDEAHEIRLARSAINSLSYSEILAMQHIFDELDGDEGLLVASRIADNAGITRSVIVNALRKLASAGVVESRSLGMKGTYLRILNKEIRNEFERQRYPYPKNI